MDSTTVGVQPVPARGIEGPTGSGRGTPLRSLGAELETLPAAMRRVAEAVLECLEDGIQASNVDLAARAGVSPATVSRFARYIGYASFGELQNALGRELGRASAEEAPTITADIRVGDDARTVVQKVVNDVVQVMRDTASSVDPAELDRTAGRIAAAGRVFLFGIGASELVAWDLRSKLERIGMNVHLAGELHRGLTLVNVLGEGDVVLCVSHSGSTREALEVLRAARAGKAWTVALTGRPLSPLAREADGLLLGVSGAESDLRPAALGSRMSQLAIVDALFVLVAQRTYDRTQKLLAGSWDALHHLHQE